MLGKTKELTHYPSEADLRVTFNVKLDPEVLAEFALLNFKYTDAAWVQLNGRTVHPSNWSNFYYAGHERVHVRTRKM